MASTPEQAAQDWVQGLSSKTAKMTAGAQAVTVSPGQSAARNAQAYLAGVQANFDKWKSRVAQVGLNDWQTAYVTKGVPRIASGAAASQAKFATFMGQLLPYVERGRTSLPQRGTFEQNTQRALAWMTYMHNFKKAGS